MRKMQQDLEAVKGTGEETFTQTLYESLDGFPLTTVGEFIEMESDEKKPDRKKLVSSSAQLFIKVLSEYYIY